MPKSNRPADEPEADREKSPVQRDEVRTGERPKQEMEQRTEQEVRRDRRIDQVRQRIKSRKRRLALNVSLFALPLSIALVVAYIYRQELFTEDNFVIVIMGLAGLIFLALHILNSGDTDTTDLRAELDKLLLDKEITERLQAKAQNPYTKDSRKQPSYFDSLVETNVFNLREYYNLVRVHTNNSFRISLSAGLFGFVLIAAGLTIGFNSGEEHSTIVYLSAASGVFIEFISGVFFYLYSRTVRQLKSYHDSLLAVQNVLLSLKLTEMADDEKRPAMIRDMLKFLMEQRKEVALDVGEAVQ